MNYFRMNGLLLAKFYSSILQKKAVFSDKLLAMDWASLPFKPQHLPLMLTPCKFGFRLFSNQSKFQKDQRKKKLMATAETTESQQ